MFRPIAACGKFTYVFDLSALPCWCCVPLLLLKSLVILSFIPKNAHHYTTKNFLSRCISCDSHFLGVYVLSVRDDEVGSVKLSSHKICQQYLLQKPGFEDHTLQMIFKTLA